MTKVLFDHQIFSSQKYGGVSRYFCELIRELRLAGEEPMLDLRFTNNCHYKEIWRGKPGFFPNVEFRGRNRLLELLNRSKTLALLREGEFDVFHPTYFDPYFLGKLGGHPFVLTVYDLTHERFPELFPHAAAEIALKRSLLGPAAKIVAISQNTKDDLVDVYGLNPGKIEVVHLATSIQSPVAPVPDLRLPPRYVLYVGQRLAYKNYGTALNAFALIRGDFPDLHFLCIGGGEFSPGELKQIDSVNAGGRVVWRSLGDTGLASAYAQAEMFVFPSLYEGFGIPILEAFACGCPTILSQASCFPEVAADAALYFPPSDADTLAEKMRLVLLDRQIRSSLCAAGKARLSVFSWKKTADRTLALYKALGDGG